MKFELEPDNFNQPDEALFADLRRVAKLVQPAGITKDLYDKHGRWCAATMRKRFKNWNDALRLAGIEPTKLVNVSGEAVISDIKSVAAGLGASNLSLSDYRLRGKFTDRPIYRNFGDWASAVRAAGLEPVFEPLPEITDELCFEAIEAVWRRLGRQPRQAEVKRPETKVSATAITKRFGSWRKALEALIKYLNEPSALGTSEAKTVDQQPLRAPSTPENAKGRLSTPRMAGWRLRFLVMRRDAFRCVICGKSPSTNIGTILVIDHVTPWSKGGDTVYENLQTLCEVCNGGRGNLDLVAEDSAE